jgi:L-rhamnose mutarotase
VSLTDAHGCTSMTEVTQLGVSTLIPETPAICMVGVENGHNLVVWEELENTNVQHYRIYRENDQANVYELLATVPAAQGNAYEDVTADPAVRAWRYKVTAMDVCQGETPMSELHKTVHLTINRGINDNWNLIWTHYEGMDFPSYRLYRGTANNNLELIATLPSTLTSYTDFDNVDGALFYQIEVVMNGSCLRHTRDVTYTGSRSNIVYNGEVVYTDTAVTACEEYDWNGTVYTQSGVYQQDYTSSLGYDVHAILHLTIVHYPGFSISGSTTIVSGGSTTLSVTPTNPQWGYLWSTGATTSSITVSPTETTTYYVTVTNGPCEISSWKTVNVTTGVNEWGDGIVSLYPNPTTGIVNIDAEGIESVEVMDMSGRVIMTSNENSVNISDLSNGVYMFRINTNAGSSLQKVVKK